jgi:hypothetical protein
MIYFCCDNKRRRNAVSESLDYNGIDFLEVSDDSAQPFNKRQRTLFVHFVEKSAPGAAAKLKLALASLTKNNVRIEGGDRIQNIKIVSIKAGSLSSPPLADNLLIVEVADPGDFSTYTLRLVTDQDSNDPPQGFDLVLSAVNFSFKVACPADIDCRDQRVCPPESVKEPEISYLAKDYASFRQLMLDRMALLAPQWKERSPADLGITMVELLAYLSDYLSYQQDAVATESYLGTARRRASVRRLARLVDYAMHDGRNARAWIHIEATSAGDGLTLKQDNGTNTTKLLTSVGLFPDDVVLQQGSGDFEKVMTLRPQVFELMHDLRLYYEHNEIKVYTWGERKCCLPQGSTQAALTGALPNLQVGDVLILTEHRGPQTGVLEDADPAHRHAVRLTKVSHTIDPLGGQFKSPPDNSGVSVTEVEWASGDALPFALCISAEVGTSFFDDVSVALGNNVLADHGMTVTDESLTSPPGPTSLDPDTVPVPNPALTRISASVESRCDDPTIQETPARYRPRVTNAPITQAAPFDSTQPGSAGVAFSESIEPDQLPLAVIHLRNPQSSGDVWQPRRDLLESPASDEAFVVEVEADGTAYLRFGDGRCGRRPDDGVRFLATYRIGNGTAGNVGADAFRHLVTSDPVFLDFSNNKIEKIYNPLPAKGGLEPETIEHVRQNAPSAFRQQERAVTPRDYEQLVIRRDVAERCDLRVQRAAATLRWTGSWHTMFLTVDRLGGAKVDPTFERDLRGCLERYRMAGQDLEVDAPRPVSLDIEMLVCIKRGYFFPDVEQALLEVFSNRTQPDGTRGVFHPDNFTFGQPVYLSSIVASAQAVTGVDSVMVTRFCRQGGDSCTTLVTEKLEIGRLEIARLDNDRNFPERGVFTLKRG